MQRRRHQEFIRFLNAVEMPPLHPDLGVRAAAPRLVAIEDIGEAALDPIAAFAHCHAPDPQLHPRPAACVDPRRHRQFRFWQTPRDRQGVPIRLTQTPTIYSWRQIIIQEIMALMNYRIGVMDY